MIKRIVWITLAGAIGWLISRVVLRQIQNAEMAPPSQPYAVAGSPAAREISALPAYSAPPAPATPPQPQETAFVDEPVNLETAQMMSDPDDNTPDDDDTPQETPADPIPLDGPEKPDPIDEPGTPQPVGEPDKPEPQPLDGPDTPDPIKMASDQGMATATATRMYDTPEAKQAARMYDAPPHPKARVYNAPINGSDDVGTSGVIGYCVKCRTKRTMDDPHEETTESGRRAARGTCPVCSTTMFTFLSDEAPVIETEATNKI